MADNSSRSRLDSWKEIADYLGRDVRTVIRWEKDKGLPVHRIPGGKRHAVFAYRDEIDTWLGSAPLNGAAGNDAEAEPVRSPRWRRVTALAGLVLAALALLYGGYGAYLHVTATPSDYRVEERAVIVLDQYGRELWRHTFGFPLVAAAYAAPSIHLYPPPQFAALRDLDGDGHAELLFATPTGLEYQAENKLYCFDRRGRILWAYRPTRTVEYGHHERPGDHRFEPPYTFGAFYLFSDGGASPDIVWATFARAPWFPTVVVKLDARGEVLAEYWHAGSLTSLAEATLAGRHVLLVGAYSNESHGPALSVLDYDNPTGFSPAESRAYLCQNCPAGKPLAYVHFPRSELTRKLEEDERVAEIRVIGENAFRVTTRIGDPEYRDFVVAGYYFDEEFKLRDVALEQDYARLHRKLMVEGILDHEVDLERERRELGEPLFWDGHAFAPQQAAASAPVTRKVPVKNSD